MFRLWVWTPGEVLAAGLAVLCVIIGASAWRHLRHLMRRPVCEGGCGCRYGTHDPDRLGCDCDGPCCFADDADWYGPRRLRRRPRYEPGLQPPSDYEIAEAITEATKAVRAAQALPAADDSGPGLSRWLLELPDRDFFPLMWFGFRVIRRDLVDDLRFDLPPWTGRAAGLPA